MSREENPVRSLDFRIPFHRIDASHVVPGVRETLREARDRIETLVAEGSPRSYRTTVRGLDRITVRVRRALKPVRHLMAVAETPELREAYNEVLPEISQFWTWLYLHDGLWGAVRQAAEGEEAEDLEAVHARHLRKTVRDFRRAGADLPAAEKERLRELRVELASLEQKFGENVLDATAAYELHVTDPERLEGVPEHARARFRARAEGQEREGWILTLDYPSYEPVLKHARDRALREELHGAYTGRCRGGEHDNRDVIRRILGLRQEIAELLGYPHFPDYRLEEAMAGTGARARDFLGDLTGRTRPYYERDLALLREQAAELGIDDLRPWDVAYVKESLRRRRHEIDDEALRPYFPLDGALEGLFGVAERVFGVKVRPLEGVEEVWHPDVGCYRVEDEGGLHLGDFYTDFFPRKEKRQGAWMNSFVTGGPDEDGTWSPHLGFMAANFTPPEGETPSLLTHREVQTLFHEFGHLLHHLCSRVPVEPRAGLNVAWDWVELPSQIMENWTWEEEAVDLLSGHHETGDPLPADLFRRLRGARRYMGGWNQMRQLGFGTVDLALHLDWAPEEGRVGSGEEGEVPGEAGKGAGEAEGERAGRDHEAAEAVVAFAEERLSDFVPGPEFARRNILTSFTHLFSGGYAAGYYSYLWSEVLEADAFGRFREEGIFSRETGRSFVDTVLARGDSAEPDELFREFMGRDPDPSALVERNLGSLEEGG